MSSHHLPKDPLYTPSLNREGRGGSWRAGEGLRGGSWRVSREEIFANVWWFAIFFIYLPPNRRLVSVNT